MLDIRNSFSLCITHCDVGLTSGVGGKWKMNVFDRSDMLGKHCSHQVRLVVSEFFVHRQFDCHVRDGSARLASFLALTGEVSKDQDLRQML